MENMASGSIRQLIDHWAETQANDVFLHCPETQQQVTFCELATHCKNIAHALVERGFVSGDRLSLLMGNGVGSACLYLGAMYGGFVISPLNPLAGTSQLSYVIQHAAPKWLLVSSEYLPLLQDCIEQSDLHVEFAVCEAGVIPQWKCTENPLLEAPSASHTALLMYTSGTTGNPKGVLHSHTSLLHGALNTVLSHELTRSDRALCVLPLYHINAQVVTILAPLLSGGSVALAKKFSASQFWAWVTLSQCTWISVVPTIVSYLLKQPTEEDPEHLDTLRFARSASAPLPPSIHQAFEARFHTPLVETMGLTESAAQILSNPLEKSQHRLGSPGLAFGNEVRIASPEGAELPPEVEGEIQVRGNNVMLGYFNNPVETDKTLRADGWMHTGDLGKRDAAGYFYVTGRTKELIIKGGENIAPREIDDVLYSHQSVLEAAAIALPCADYGQTVAACLVLKSNQRFDRDALVTLCNERLGPYKTPSQFFIMPSLPKGPSGKIQRLKLVDIVSSLSSESES